MNSDTRNQEANFDDILERINSLREDSQNEPVEKKTGTDGGILIDQEIFERVKEEQKTKSHGQAKNPLQRMLDGDEDETKEEARLLDQEEYEDRPDIEEFQSEDEIEEIYRDLKNTVGKMAVKGFAAFLFALVSLYLFLAGFKPAFFGGDVSTVWFQVAWLAIDAVSIVLFFGIFREGLLRVLRARLDTDGMLFFLWIGIVLWRIICLIKQEWISPTMNFEPMMTLGLWYNIRSKKMIASNIKKNFKYISAKMDKYTATKPVVCELNNRLILETETGGGTAFLHRTKLVSNFIENSFSDYECDKSIYHINFLFVLLVLAGSIAISQLTGVKEGLAFPAAAIAVVLPFFSRYYYAKSIALNGKKIRKSGGVLTSVESAKKLEDTDLLVLSDAELLGEDSVLLQGVKAIGDLQLDTLITYVAALFNKRDCIYKKLFMRMVDTATVDLPKVDDEYYHAGMGYSCLIHSKMFLVGNLGMMWDFNIQIPEKLCKLGLGPTKFPVYVAYHKQAVGVFIVSYEHNNATDQAFSALADTEIDLGIVSGDFNFSLELLKKIYPQSQGIRVHILPKDTAKGAALYLDKIEKSGDYVASISGFNGLAVCFRGVGKILTGLKINFVIRVLYPIIALALMFFIGLSGYSDNTALQILLFQIIWMLPICAICRFCK